MIIHLLSHVTSLSVPSLQDFTDELLFLQGEPIQSASIISLATGYHCRKTGPIKSEKKQEFRMETHHSYICCTACSLLVSACVSGHALCQGTAATVYHQNSPDPIVVVCSYHWLESSKPHLRKDYIYHWKAMHTRASSHTHCNTNTLTHT